MKPVVAILGRPNVGKSTLFNRLIGSRRALVAPTPGVTRDRREGAARLGRLEFAVVDTAGLEEAPASELGGAMQEQARRAALAADVVLLVVDARAGVTPADEFFANEVRRGGTPSILVANKCESRAADAGVLDCARLGLGPPVAVAAEHGIGMSDLELALDERFSSMPAPGSAAGDASLPEAPGADGDGDRGPLRLVIAGRPNVGKSTLLNRLLGDERVITSPEPGTTHDAIAVRWDWGGRRFELVDTAGLRRKARIAERLERLSVGDTLEAIRLSHVVILALDANQMPERQDLAIARHVIEEGRAMVIAVNKWDAAFDRDAARLRLENRLETSLPQVRGVPVVALSALTGDGVDHLLPRVLHANAIWNRRVATGPLNRWIEEVVERHPPPLHRGRRVRIRYVTQSGVRPPTFTVFVNRPRGVPESYVRYLANEIRESFGFPGVPIRIQLRRRDNPYAADGSG